MAGDCSCPPGLVVCEYHRLTQHLEEDRKSKVWSGWGWGLALVFGWIVLFVMIFGN